MLEYEDLAEASQRARTMRHVCDFLGVDVNGDQDALLPQPPPPLLRQRTQPLADVVGNYHVLRLDQVRDADEYCVDMHDLLGQPHERQR